MKGQEWRESVTEKAKGKGKSAMEPPQKKNADVIIYIGLATWSDKCGCLKKKDGKRMAFRANTKDSASTILQKIVSKWKAFNSDNYIEDKRLQKPTLGCLFKPLIRKRFNLFETVSSVHLNLQLRSVKEVCNDLNIMSSSLSADRVKCERELIKGTASIATNKVIL